MIYSSTYEISPNVRLLEGDWVASNVFEQGNTLTLSVTPEPDIENTTSAYISGQDSLGNQFTGSGNITIHYTAENEVEGNVYDVTLSFNGRDLSGLATYVLERTTQGVDPYKKTLAIGVSSADSATMVSVLSTLGN